MHSGLALSRRRALVTVAAAAYLAALGAVAVGWLMGGGNGSARGWIELADAVLCGVVALSFHIKRGSFGRRYFQLLEAAMVMFGISFAGSGALDLLGSTALAMVAGGALIAGAVVLVAAVVHYVGEHHPSERRAASVLDLAILVVAVLALVGPLILVPLATTEGIRGFSVGLAWSLELAVFVGTVWIALGWVRPAQQMDFVALVGGLGGALCLASVHVAFDLLGHPSIPWWVQAIYGPGLIVIALSPELAITPPDVLIGGDDEWSSVRAYLPYVPVGILVLVALGMAIAGHVHGSLGRGLVAGALTVSILLVIRQAVLLHAHRRLLDMRSLQALRDPLTGLLNRRAFDEDLVQLANLARRDETTLALILIDVDNLKQVNDGPGGHGAGDELLAGLADALRRSGRREDRVYRIGGDEFAMLLPTADHAVAGRSLARTRAALERGFPGRCFSAGVALLPTDAADSGALLQLADRTLYQAKSGSAAGAGRLGRPAAIPLS
ncbi:MAG: GGDEF domain-containing protein [Candidatus Dormibacteraeota bacterium]|nr:GGDEF domain-containing protein [Candidatus Dormibacteraeota bacterium]